MNRSESICSSCRKPKYQLKAKASRLKPDTMLYLCETCLKQRLEPRWIVMMVGRDQGFDAIKDYIKPQRYLGEPILLEDMY